MLCSIFAYACLGYVALLFGCHLYDCWVHPPVKPIAAVAESPVLLLPPASEPHSFELSLERMPALEMIAAVHQPAATPEPSAELLDVEELLDVIDIEPPSDYALMTIRELKRIASDRRIPGYSKKTKSELIELLTA